MNFNGRAIALQVLCALLLAQTAIAARCPECELNYAKCAWSCYSSSGWQPKCVVFVTAKEDALNQSPDPASAQVLPNTCEADCYVKNLGDLNQLVGFQVVGSSNANDACEARWRTKQALTYLDFTTGPYPELLNPPQWMVKEVAMLQVSPVDEGDVNSALNSCLSCNAKPTASPSPSPSLSPPPEVESPPPPPKPDKLSPPPVLSPPVALSPTIAPAVAPVPEAVTSVPVVATPTPGVSSPSGAVAPSPANAAAPLKQAGLALVALFLSLAVMI